MSPKLLKFYQIYPLKKNNFFSDKLTLKLFFLAEKTSNPILKTIENDLFTNFGIMKKCDYNHNKQCLKGTHLRIVEKCQILTMVDSDFVYHIAKTHSIDPSSYSIGPKNDCSYELIYIQGEKEETIKTTTRASNDFMTLEFLPEINKFENSKKQSKIYFESEEEETRKNSLIERNTIKLIIDKEIEIKYYDVMYFLRKLCEKCYYKKNEQITRESSIKLKIVLKEKVLFPSDFAFSYSCGSVEFFPTHNVQEDIKSFGLIIGIFYQIIQDERLKEFQTSISIYLINFKFNL